jgi:hypothetical protein
MATAPVQLDEESLIREQIAQVELPEGVRLKSIRPMIESTGEEAWRIIFSASTKIPLSKSRLAQLGQVRNDVMDRIFSLRLHRYPFVFFDDGR